MDSNIYTDFIEYLKNCEKELIISPEIKREKHRILPQHDGGTYEKSNVVLCTFENHRLAHYSRYLAYKQAGDYIAWNLMRGMTEQARKAMASYAGRLGGTALSKISKEKEQLFFSKEWQKMYGDRGGGKRNVESGRLVLLNREINENQPELRSRAGRLGGKKVSAQQKKDKKHFFDPKKSIQRKGNLVRWGAVVDGVRVPYNKLSPEFIEKYLNGENNP